MKLLNRMLKQQRIGTENRRDLSAICYIMDLQPTVRGPDVIHVTILTCSETNSKLVTTLYIRLKKT